MILPQVKSKEMRHLSYQIKKLRKDFFSKIDQLAELMRLIVIALRHEEVYNTLTLSAELGLAKPRWYQPFAHLALFSVPRSDGNEDDDGDDGDDGDENSDPLADEEREERELLFAHLERELLADLDAELRNLSEDSLGALFRYFHKTEQYSVLAFLHRYVTRNFHSFVLESLSRGDIERPPEALLLRLQWAALRPEEDHNRLCAELGLALYFLPGSDPRSDPRSDGNEKSDPQQKPWRRWRQSLLRDIMNLWYEAH